MLARHIIHKKRKFSDPEIALDSRGEVLEANCQFSTAHFVFSGQHFMTSHSSPHICRWANVKGELLLASRHHQGLISCFQFHHWWLPSCLSTLVSDKKMGKHCHPKPPSELLTCLNANDLLVLHPTHSTAYQAGRWEDNKPSGPQAAFRTHKPIEIGKKH